MYRPKGVSTKGMFLWGLLLFVLVGCDGGGGGGATGGGTNDPALVGTWTLLTENGQPPSESVTLTLTSSTYTAVSSGCTESGTYSTSGGSMTYTTTAVSGSGCDAAVGESDTIPYTVTATTLTITVNGDTEVFTRA